MFYTTTDIVYAIIFVFGNIGITIGVCVYLVCLLEKYNLLSYARVDKFEHVKNAMFTLGLMIVYKDSVSNNPVYDEYDWTELPSLSGCDMANALISYMYAGHSGTMYKKSLAIKRFLDKHICSDEQQEEFIMRYFNTIVDYIQKANTPDTGVQIDSDEDEISAEDIPDEDYASADDLKED